MSLQKGQMQITVLPDGRIKVETSDMAGAAHKAADDFLKLLAQLAGGEVIESKLERGHHHGHDHDHEHSHESGAEHHHH